MYTDGIRFVLCSVGGTGYHDTLYALTKNGTVNWTQVGTGDGVQTVKSVNGRQGDVVVTLDELDVSPSLSLREMIDNMPVYNVKDFGAKGDNVTDDTEAFQAAITAAQDDSGRGVVLVPAGMYLIKRTLDAKNSFHGITIRGTDEGFGNHHSCIVVDSDFDGDCLIDMYNDETYQYNINFDHISVIVNTPLSSCVFKLKEVQESFFDHVAVYSNIGAVPTVFRCRSMGLTWFRSCAVGGGYRIERWLIQDTPRIDNGTIYIRDCNFFELSVAAVEMLGHANGNISFTDNWLENCARAIVIHPEVGDTIFKKLTICNNNYYTDQNRSDPSCFLFINTGSDNHLTVDLSMRDNHWLNRSGTAGMMIALDGNTKLTGIC